MSTKPYGLICPISKACEVLQPRWTMQILSELWAGSSRFNDIRRALGGISSTVLSRRLAEMEAAGLVGLRRWKLTMNEGRLNERLKP